MLVDGRDRKKAGDDLKGEERRGLMMTVVWSCYRSGVPA